MKEVQSPCISICRYDSKGVCFGCQRTLEEAGRWSTYSNEERLSIIKETKKRSNVQGESPNVFLR